MSRESVEVLSQHLADTYILYLKTQNFHWNVVGPQFHSLHEMFETQYQELAEATDSLAERIRALKHHAPGSFEQFKKIATLSEATSVPKANDMIKQLLADHETIAKNMHESLSVFESEDDDVSEDMIIERVEYHQKIAWMLRSLLG